MVISLESERVAWVRAAPAESMEIVPAWPVLLEELMRLEVRLSVAVSRSMVPALPVPVLEVEMMALLVRVILAVL